MGRLIQQWGPDQFRVWSTVSDSYVFTGTAIELEEWYVRRAVADEQQSVRDALANAGIPEEVKRGMATMPPYIRKLKERRAPLCSLLSALDPHMLAVLKATAPSTSDTGTLDSTDTFQALRYMEKLDYVENITPKPNSGMPPRFYRRTLAGDARAAEPDPDFTILGMVSAEDLLMAAHLIQHMGPPQDMRKQRVAKWLRDRANEIPETT